MITKKDFQVVVNVLANFKLTSTVNNKLVEPDQAENILDMFVYAFRANYANFDEAKFTDEFKKLTEKKSK